MKQLLSLCSALALTLALTACGSTPPDAPKESGAAEELRIVLAEERLSKELEYTADDGTALLIEKCELPQLAVRTAAGEVYTPPAGTAPGDIPQEYRSALAFNAEMQREAEELDTSAQEELEMARDHYASLDAEQRAYWTNYAEELIVDSVYSCSGLVSVRGAGYFNAGGAHGWEHTRTWNFDLAAGEFLTLDSLDAQPSTDSALGETLTHTLAMSVLSQIDAQNLAEYYFEDYASYVFDLSANANFSLDDKGMTVTFDPAVIAPYAASAQEFFIPYRSFYNALDAHTQSLLDVSEDERVIADYNTAKILWSWFYATTPPVDTGAPGITVDGLELARVTLGSVNTLDGLRALLCEHVSEDVADTWLATGRFVESDGALYASCFICGTADAVGSERFAVEWSSSTEGKLIQTVTLQNWDSEKGALVPSGAQDTYEYPFTLTNGHAVFSAFPCPY